ncbi:hypothetical protein LCGC14_1435550 [marine sediment metagenome]|uniref:Uncharacterized protein n=1 Tax=marine sediment metagenome TaxID=412755 RepID=A0A0F9K8H6_9ZZZZ
MSDKKPATKIVKKPATRKPQKITYPRLFNAVEDLVNGAGLTAESTIKDLYDALQAAIVKDARGK